MGKNTKIEWCDHSFSSWWGCTRVSPGCAHCYAAELGNRFGVKWGSGEPRRLSSEKVWAGPVAWNKSAQQSGKRIRVFCGSMMDWADEEAPAGARTRLWSLIRNTKSIDWLMLTKRPENVPDLLPHDWRGGWDHVHLGFTAENQLNYDRRIAIMESIPAVRRFISCEPLLGSIQLGLENWIRRGKIHQVIVGGESGREARPMHPAWARSLRDQCVAAGVPFHFKQWGEWTPGENVTDQYGERGGKYPTKHPWDGGWTDCDDDWMTEQDHGPILYRVGKKKAGRLLDGQEWNQFPQPIGPGNA